jgi:LacI family transcriptional regulator
MNYRPNPIALSLKERKSRSIGVIVCEIANDFFSQAINGIESIAYNRGYHVIITQSHESYEREVVNLNHLASRSVDGLLVSVSAETTHMDHFRQLHEKGLPIVFFDRVPEDITTHKVILNNYQASYNATTRLIQAGYKRIVTLTSAAQLSITRERLAGYKAALRDNGILFKEDAVKYCTHGGMIISEVEEALNKLLKTKPGPDAIFAASDRITTACMTILQHKNLHTQNGPTLIGFSNSLMIELLNPRPDVVRQPAFEMGQVATELLMQIIESKRTIVDFETRVLEATI